MLDLESRRRTAFLTLRKVAEALKVDPPQVYEFASVLKQRGKEGPSAGTETSIANRVVMTGD
jgi:hypothetical protein